MDEWLTEKNTKDTTNVRSKKCVGENWGIVVYNLK